MMLGWFSPGAAPRQSRNAPAEEAATAKTPDTVLQAQSISW